MRALCNLQGAEGRARRRSPSYVYNSYIMYMYMYPESYMYMS